MALKSIPKESLVSSLRHAKIEVREKTDDTITFSFSSEYPCERWWGTEILSHENEAINLERLSGMTFLWNHDRDKVLGKITRIWIEDKRGYCQAKWSRNELPQSYKQDVEDEILSNVSFCYSIDEILEDKKEEKYTVTKWTPQEISLVSVPADPTVGIGRSTEFNLEKNIIEGRIVPDLEIREKIINDERARIAAINALSEKHGHIELAVKLIEQGRSIDEAREAYLGKISNTIEPVARAINPLGLSDKEQKRYSIVKAINAATTNNWSKAGFERECSDEISNSLNRGTAGFFVPLRDLRVEQRATYATGASGTGGATIQTDVMAQNFIDLLRNKAMIMQLGATMLSGLQGNVDIPGQATAAQVYWVSEGGDVTQSEGTFRTVQLRPKTIGAISRFTRNMLLQSSIDIEQFIRNDFAQIIALGIDSAAIAGTGLNNQPTGILNTAGIGSVALGTNGAAPTWDSIVGLETEVAIDNADVNTCYYLANAATRGKLKRTQKFASTNGDPIWNDGNLVNGYMAACSNQVPSNLTKGSGTNLSAIVFGDFSQLIVGEWGVLEIIANSFSDAVFASGGVEVRALSTVDVALRYAQSFAAITDAVTT